MKTGDFSFSSPILSSRELGFMFCTVRHMGKRFLLLSIPFLSRRWYSRLSPIEGAFSFELYNRLLDMLPAIPETKNGENRLDGETWLVLQVNSWLRIERKARRLFRKYPKAETAAVVLDGAKLPSDVCVLEGGFSTPEAIDALKKVTASAPENASYVLINREDGFTFPKWPIPTLPGWD